MFPIAAVKILNAKSAGVAEAFFLGEMENFIHIPKRRG